MIVRLKTYVVEVKYATKRSTKTTRREMKNISLWGSYTT